MLPLSQFSPDMHVVLLSRRGMIKLVPLKQFKSISSRGLAAMTVKVRAVANRVMLVQHGKLTRVCRVVQGGDKLQFVALASLDDSILLASSSGVALHFSAENLRPMGRAASGNKVWLLARTPHARTPHASRCAWLTGSAFVQTMNLDPGSEIVAMSVLPKGLATAEEEDGEGAADDEADAHEDDDEEDAAGGTSSGPSLLLITAQGLGKRTPVAAFRMQRRVGKGRKALKLNPGDRLAAAEVVGSRGSDAGSGEAALDLGDALVSTTQGLLVRVPVKDIQVREQRSTKGHKIVSLAPGDSVAAVTLMTRSEHPDDGL